MKNRFPILIPRVKSLCPCFCIARKRHRTPEEWSWSAIPGHLKSLLHVRCPSTLHRRFCCLLPEFSSLRRILWITSRAQSWSTIPTELVAILLLSWGDLQKFLGIKEPKSTWNLWSLQMIYNHPKYLVIKHGVIIT
jgi:hypothetical protein